MTSARIPVAEVLNRGVKFGKGAVTMANANRGNTGLRVIVFIGAATFLLLMLMAFGLKRSLEAPKGAAVPPGNATSPFREDRAWEDFRLLAAFGPSTHGSSSLKARQAYVSAALHQARLKTRDFITAADDSTNNARLNAVAGVVEGNRPGIIILCAALDSSPDSEAGLDFRRSAANVAWLLEMGRALGSERDGRSVWLLFLNGESPTAPDGGSPSLRGSQAVVDSLKQSGELTDVGAVLCVDGIGDCLLSVQKDLDAPRELSEIIWNTAARQGYGDYFGKLPTRVRQSDLPFRDAGIAALALVDSGDDTAQAPADPCRESLRAVGDVIYHALAPLDGHLDGAGTHSDGH